MSGRTVRPERHKPLHIGNGLLAKHSSLADVDVAVAVARHNQRLSHAVVTELRALGCRTTKVLDGDPAGMKVDVLVLLGDCRLFSRYARVLRDRPDDRPHVVAWQADPLPPPSLDANLEKKAVARAEGNAHRPWLKLTLGLTNYGTYKAIAERGLGDYSNRAGNNFVDLRMARLVVESYAFIRQGVTEKWVDHVLTSTIGKQRFLASRGIAAAFAPLGYYPSIGEDRGLERDIDVLFLGKLTNRRNRRLESIVPVLEQTGARVVVIGEGLSGEARIALLNRVKMVLHLHKYPWDTPWMRWTLAAANGALMVSEPLSDPEPFLPGVHYVEAPFKELPEVITHLRADPDRLAGLAKAGESFVKESFTLRQSVGTLLSTSLASRHASDDPSN